MANPISSIAPSLNKPPLLSLPISTLLAASLALKFALTEATLLCEWQSHMADNEQEEQSGDAGRAAVPAVSAVRALELRVQRAAGLCVQTVAVAAAAQPAATTQVDRGKAARGRTCSGATATCASQAAALPYAIKFLRKQ